MRRPFLIIGWLLITSGLVALAAGWAGVQSTPVVAVQLSYLVSGALVGIALVTIGTGLQGHDDTRAIRELLEELRDRYDDLENAVAEVQKELAAPRRRMRSVK
jgi:hypothetical protein